MSFYNPKKKNGMEGGGHLFSSDTRFHSPSCTTERAQDWKLGQCCSQCSVEGSIHKCSCLRSTSTVVPASSPSSYRKGSRSPVFLMSH